MKRTPFARPLAVMVVLVMLASSLAVVALAHPSSSFSPHSPVSAVRASPSAIPLVAEHPTPYSHSYAVTFSESGLPGGLVWAVTLGVSTSQTTTDGSTDTVGFFVANGSYSYSIPDIGGWHQGTMAYHGTVVVSGAAISEPTLLYLQVKYSVSFSESGLPSGQTFQVTLNGTTHSLLTDGATDSLAFSQPNGSLAYHVADVPGWHQSTLAYVGHVTVSGATLTVTTLVFSQVTYSVSFSESGLPSGKTFAVTVNGVPKSLTTNGALDTLTWTGLTNGTYSYSVADVPGWHQTLLPYSGNVVVNGASVAEPTMVFAKSNYSLIFSESGLPAGLLFKVTVAASVESLTTDGATDSLLFAETNGSISYSVADNPGWHQTTLAYVGHVTINGSAVIEPVLVYTQVTYSVTFHESGLPGATNWSVTLNGDTESSNGTTIAFTEPNGTYPFKIGYVAGYATTPTTGNEHVAGAGLSTNVPFTQVTYAVTFDELNLPTGTGWSVTIGAHTVSSTSASLAFSLPNGTYGYTINYVSGWVPPSPTGSVVVAGGPVTTTIPFSMVTYSYTFTETGLPTSAHPKAWSVAIDGAVRTSTGSSIVFPVGNGTHSYLVKGPYGWRVSSILPPAGSFTVTGANGSQSVLFLRGSTPSITFHERGLAVGTRWCVTLGALLCSTTARIVSKNLTPGTYTYAVQSVTSLTTLVKLAGGSVGPTGSVALLHGVTFQVRFAYEVTFTESGLPPSTSWEVSAGGEQVPSTNTHVVLYLINGTYTFHVTKVTGYHASPSSGGIRVMGAPISVSVRFTVA